MRDIRAALLELKTSRIIAYVLVILTSAFLYYHILSIARLEFGSARILGWDSLKYALMGQEVLSQGIPYMLAQWHHPNVYGLLLAGASGIVPTVETMTNVLPAGLVVLLSLSGAVIVGRIAGTHTGVVAGILTATSIGTLRLFSDLHRALFALLAVTILIAIDSAKVLSRTKLDHRTGLAVLLLFLVAFSEFEIYLLYLLATVFALALRKERWLGWGLTILWSIIPGILFALTPSPAQILGNLAFVVERDLARQLTLDSLLFLVPIFTIPFSIFGAAFLLRETFLKRDSTGTILLSWVLAVLSALLVLSFVVRAIPPWRALILLHLPLLVSFGMRYMFVWLAGLTHKTSRNLPPGHFAKIQLPDQTLHVGFALFATIMIVASGIIVIERSEFVLIPIVPDGLYDRLRQSSEHVRGNDWPEPIYLVLNRSTLLFLNPIRFELGLLNDNPTYLYNGDLNFLPWFAHPNRIFPPPHPFSAYSLNMAGQYYLLENALHPEPLGLLAHPIIIISPELFPRSLPSSFNQFHVGDGIFVIPPGSLTLERFLSWPILATEDHLGLGKAYRVPREWSYSTDVVEIYTREGYNISFPHFFPASGEYTISIHLFDFPSLDSVSGLPLTPVQLLIDGEVIDTLHYGRSEVVWWNVTYQSDPSLAYLSLRASETGMPFRLSLDQLVVTLNES